MTQLRSTIRYLPAAKPRLHSETELSCLQRALWMSYKLGIVKYAHDKAGAWLQQR